MTTTEQQRSNSKPDKQGQTSTLRKRVECVGGNAAPLNTASLFAGSREILIEHGDRQYRLRITRNNGLILNAVS